MLYSWQSIVQVNIYRIRILAKCKNITKKSNVKVKKNKQTCIQNIFDIQIKKNKYNSTLETKNIKQFYTNARINKMNKWRLDMMININESICHIENISEYE